MVTAINNIVPKYYKWDGANHNVYHNTTVNPKPIIFINGYFEVDNDITFTDCRIQFGEQAEMHVLTGQTLRFTGCDVQSCNGYTWRSIYADEGATVIVEDNSGTPTAIADADTALNLNNDADYNVIKSTFTNNYVGMYLYSYKRAVVSGSMGNIYGNTFTSSGTLNTPPVGAALAYGRSGISLNHSQSIQIGVTGQTANTFENLYLGIQSSNSNMEVFNNDFKNIHSLWGTTSGYAIYATSDFDYNDRTMNIGNHYSSGLNDFKSSETGVYAYGEQNISIKKNKFGNATQVTDQITQRCIYIANNTKAIDVLKNDFYDFNIGTYLYDIKKSSSIINIGNNTYHNADLGLGGTDYGTAITVQNYTPTENNLNIYDNTIINPRVGIHLKKVINAKIYKDATGNIISFNLGTGSLSHSYYGVLLDHCDDVFVHENTIDNNGQPNSSTNLRGINAITSTGGNYCSNTISEMGYSMYFEGNCDNVILKRNVLKLYESALYFNTTYFANQGTSTETWENKFDDNITNKYRLDGNGSASQFTYYYNTGNSLMDVSNIYHAYNALQLIFITSSGSNPITDCDPLPSLRSSNYPVEHLVVSDFNLFPNPAQDYIHIQNLVVSDGSFDYFIFDSTGKLVSSKLSSSSTVDMNISDLNNGIYFLIIKGTAGIRHHVKFIVNR